MSFHVFLPLKLRDICLCQTKNFFFSLFVLIYNAIRAASLEKKNPHGFIVKQGICQNFNSPANSVEKCNDRRADIKEDGETCGIIVFFGRKE